MADQVPTKARSIVERMLDPEIQEQLTRRGRAFAEAINAAAESASGRAAATWQDAEPVRRQAATVGREALRWGSRTWIREMQPSLRRLWSRRGVALSTAGAAVPAARELIDDAAVRLGIRKRREERHWGAFFAGLLIGAIAGAIAAILTAPKAGAEMRDEIAGTARDAATRAKEVAGRAREAAASAGEWVPIFQRPATDGASNGEATADAVVEAPEVKPAAQGRKRAASSPPSEEAAQPD
jgi:gas vesicle protein